MKKNNYNRVITDPHFKPLSEMKGRKFPVTEGQVELAKKLNKDYLLSEYAFLLIIKYVEFAYLPGEDSKAWQREFENINRMLDSEESFDVRLEYENKFSEIIKDRDNISLKTDSIPFKGKKIFLEQSIKKIATEIFNQLTIKENISEWKSLCIIGFIFAFYHIGISYDNPIQTKTEHKISHPGENYLSYLSGNIKRYINK
jgi:hypothetical protein